MPYNIRCTIISPCVVPTELPDSAETFARMVFRPTRQEL